MQVQLLGGFGVEVGGRRVDAARWRLRKARTVVKLLALEPAQRLHREYVLDLLWPDLPPPAAANNLHQALHAARRALAGEQADGMLELRDHVVVLRADGLVEVDVARFRELAEAALDSDDLDGLRAAHAAYQGELLPEDRYETWARGPREELHVLHRDVLVRLGDRFRVAGRLAEAEAALEQALARDPLHEPALRSLLRVLAEEGRRSAALRPATARPSPCTGASPRTPTGLPRWTAISPSWPGATAPARGRRSWTGSTCCSPPASASHRPSDLAPRRRPSPSVAR